MHPTETLLGVLFKKKALQKLRVKQTTLSFKSNIIKLLINKEFLYKFKRRERKFMKGIVSKETVVLRRWGSSIQTLVLSTELIM